MLHIKSLALALTFGLMATAQGNAAEKYAYDSVPGDPLHAKIYTLPNGLKIFMSQNELPFFQSKTTGRICINLSMDGIYSSDVYLISVADVILIKSYRYCCRLFNFGLVIYIIPEK